MYGSVDVLDPMCVGARRMDIVIEKYKSADVYACQSTVASSVNKF